MTFSFDLVGLPILGSNDDGFAYHTTSGIQLVLGILITLSPNNVGLIDFNGPLKKQAAAAPARVQAAWQPGPWRR